MKNLYFAFLFILLAFTPFESNAQTLNFWRRVNKGFSTPCPSLRFGSGTEANWNTFSVPTNGGSRPLSYKEGQAYSYIVHPTCGHGMFRFDTVSREWEKVATTPSNMYFGGGASIALYSNNATILGLYGDGSKLQIAEHTTDYVNYPNGWKVLSGAPTIGSVMGGACTGIFSNCSSFIGFGSYGGFGTPAHFVGDTLYGFMLGSSNQFVVFKFAYKTATWSYENLGNGWVPVAGGGEWDWQVTDPSAYGGIFKYFMNHPFDAPNMNLGTIPTYVKAFKQTTSTWVNISNGVDWTNRLGNGNAGAENLRTSWNRQKLYIQSEQGTWQWGGTGWYWVASSWGASKIYPTSAGIFVDGPDGFSITKGAVKYLLGQSNDSLATKRCFEDRFYHITTPDDGRTWYMYKEGPANPNNCSSGSNVPQKILELKIPSVLENSNMVGGVQNLHVTSATFLGAASQDNKPASMVIGGNMEIFAAGSFQSVSPGSRPAFTNVSFAGSLGMAAGKAKVIRLNPLGDTIRSVITLAGDTVFDMDIMRKGAMNIAISGSWGIAVFDSSFSTLKWYKPNAMLASTATDRKRIDIDDNTGKVAVLCKSHFVFYYDANGNLLDSTRIMKGSPAIPRDYPQDITLNQDTLFIVGMDNNVNSGVPVQIAFAEAWRLNSSTLTKIWTSWAFTGGVMDYDMADTRLYRCDMGPDRGLYVFGEQAGGDGAFRWNGKITKEQNGGVDPAYTLVSCGDNYSDAFNMGAASHIGYLGKVRTTDGVVQRGQFIIPRTVGGTASTFRAKDNGDIKVSDSGHVYVIGKCNYRSKGRDMININGQLIGAYNGGDPSLYVVTNDFRSRIFWGTFTKKFGSNDGRGNAGVIANRKENSACLFDWREGGAMPVNAIHPDPFQPLPTDGSDAYLVTWAREFWKYANKDTLSLVFKPGDSIIKKLPPNPLSLNTGVLFKNNFCPGEAVSVPYVVSGYRFLPGNVFRAYLSDASGNFASEVEIGSRVDTLTGTIFAVIPSGTPAGNFYKIRVKGSSPRAGFTAPFIGTPTQVSFTIGQHPLDQPDMISGPDSVCANQGSIVYSIPPVPAAVGYIWNLPAGATLVSGQNTTTAVINWGASAGKLSVSAILLCGVGQPASVNVRLKSCTLPMADFVASPLTACVNQTVTFTNLSLNATSYSWNFGSGSSPATATGVGPHNVTYSTSGLKTITLSVNSGASVKTKTNYVLVNSGVTGAAPAISGDNNLCNIPTGTASGVNLITSVDARTSSTPNTTPNAFPSLATMTDANNLTFQGTNNEDNIWFRADLGADKNIDRAFLICKESNIRNMRLQYATAAAPSTWIDLKVITNSGALVYDFSGLGVNGRYVRWFMETRWIGGWDMAQVAEMGVYGPDQRMTYTIPAVTGATQYTWTLPNGTTQVTTSPSILIDWASVIFTSPGTLSVSHNSPCASWTSTSMSIQKSVNCNTPPTLATTGITGVYCAGVPISVPFTVGGTGSLTTGNIFTLQLSDQTGSFASPYSIGTSSGTTSGTITGLIPSSVPAGNLYRVRVLSSAIPLTASDNTNSLTVRTGVNEWEGDVSTDWHVAPNWSCSYVPDSTVNALIPPVATRTCVITQATPAYAKHLTIGNGGNASLTIQNQRVLRLWGNLNVTGTSASAFIQSGADDTLSFHGDTIQSITFANASDEFNHLRIEKRGGYVVLTDSQTVQKNLLFAGSLSKLRIGAYTLRILGTVTGASANRYIVNRASGAASGMVRRSVANMAGPVLFPVGDSVLYSPATLTNTGTTSDFRVRTFPRVHTQGLSGALITNKVVKRTWEITPATSGVNTAITLQWNAADEDGLFNRANSYISKNRGLPSSNNWVQQQAGGAASGSGPYTRSVSGITVFSKFGVGSDNSLLPVEGVILTGKVAGSDAVLNWKPIGKGEDVLWTVEQLNNGESRILAENLSTLTFRWKPETWPVVVRIKGETTSGRILYSNTLVLDSKYSFIQVYPNPSSGQVQLTLNGFEFNEEVDLRIWTPDGRLLHHVQKQVMETESALNDYLLNVSAGCYILDFRISGSVYKERLQIIR